MIEHQEIFWSLFTVDMDATLVAQPPDTWESFQLFQLLNEYLSNDRKCLNVSCFLYYLASQKSFKYNASVVGT